MGMLRGFLNAFVEEWRKAEAKTAYRPETSIRVSANTTILPDKPCKREWLYPAELPSFDEIAKGGHCDLRALVYTMLRLDANRTRPFSLEELSAQDFGSAKAAYTMLTKAGLIKKLKPEEEIAALLPKEEMKAILIERGISDKGKKQRLAEKLIDSGYTIDRRKYRKRLFKITEKGKEELERHQSDRRRAVNDAICALRELNYADAVSSYRAFDSKWGFSHTSGKVHTIFAYYDIPQSRFSFVERYPMAELNNTERFKRNLRACIIAGMMRGCQDGDELRQDFEATCEERIDCPRLLDLFDYDSAVLSVMRRQIEANPGNAMQYYISHLGYLSRRDSI